MLDIGWSELMVIGVLALIVVGPKELPRLLRTVGQFVGRARSIARDFQRSMEDAAREADLKELTDLKRDVEGMGRVGFNEQAKRSSASLKSSGAGRKPGAPVAAKPAEAAPAEPAPPEPAPAPAGRDATAAAPDGPAPKAASADR